MEISLLNVEEKDLSQLKKMAQEAFRKGFEDKFGKTDEDVLP